MKRNIVERFVSIGKCACSSLRHILRLTEESENACFNRLMRLFFSATGRVDAAAASGGSFNRLMRLFFSATQELQ